MGKWNQVKECHKFSSVVQNKQQKKTKTYLLQRSLLLSHERFILRDIATPLQLLCLCINLSANTNAASYLIRQS